MSLGRVDGAEQVPAADVPSVCAAVRGGSVEFGLVPFENTVEGPVPTTTDELVVGGGLRIVQETFLPVSFVLCARPGISIVDVRSVASHPHGRAQVRGWLAANLSDAEYFAVGSTAGAAELVAAGQYDAAVCARIAAEVYDLDVLADRIEDSDGAITRFALLARPAGGLPEPTGNDRTTFVVHIRQEQPGALSGVLVELASRSINLTRIESRPWRERIGEYHFILECEGHVADPRVGEALAALHRVCADVQFLGSYPRADRTNETLPETANDEAFAEAAEWLDSIRRGEVAE